VCPACYTCPHVIISQSSRFDNLLQGCCKDISSTKILTYMWLYSVRPWHYVWTLLTLMTLSTRDCILSEADNAAVKWGEYLVLCRNVASAYDRDDDVISRSSKANLRLRLGLGERYDETKEAGSVADRLWRPLLRDVLLLGKSTEYFQAKYNNKLIYEYVENSLFLFLLWFLLVTHTTQSK
jgi:hypothetical protein